MSKTTAAAIEAAIVAAEPIVAAYHVERAAIEARRVAGELTFPAAQKARLAASVAPSRAVRAMLALAESDTIEGTVSEDLGARAERLTKWEKK